MPRLLRLVLRCAVASALLVVLVGCGADAASDQVADTGPGADSTALDSHVADATVGGDAVQDAGIDATGDDAETDAGAEDVADATDGTDDEAIDDAVDADGADSGVADGAAGDAGLDAIEDDSDDSDAANDDADATDVAAGDDADAVDDAEPETSDGEASRAVIEDAEAMADPMSYVARRPAVATGPTEPGSDADATWSPTDGANVPDGKIGCVDGSGCDDLDDCTNDVCVGGVCWHFDTCGTPCTVGQTGICGANMYCSSLANACGTQGVCRDVATCQKVNFPVCGCDGKTYATPCEAAAADAGFGAPGGCP